MTTDMHSDMMKAFMPKEEKRKLPLTRAVPAMGDVRNNILGNTFYKNLGDGRYQEISDAIGAETYWPWGMSVGDLNADGYQDVFVSSGMGYDFRYGKNVLLINQHGKIFKSSEYALRIEPRANGNIIEDYFEIDCGGADKNRAECLEIFNQGHSCLVIGVCYHNGFVTGARSSRSSVIFDLDNDGDLDIVTNEFNDVPQVLVSNLAQRNKIHYLKIQLTGTISNRNAIGTRVTIFYGDSQQVRYADAKSGYFSQSQIPLYFGLGAQRAVDRIEIVWPSGRTQVIDKDVKINSSMHITEP